MPVSPLLLVPVPGKDTVFICTITTLLVPLEFGGERAQERIRLQEALRGFSFVREVKESDANFFLVQASVIECCVHVEMGVCFGLVWSFSSASYFYSTLILPASYSSESRRSRLHSTHHVRLSVKIVTRLSGNEPSPLPWAQQPFNPMSKTPECSSLNHRNLECCRGFIHSIAFFPSIPSTNPRSI